MISVEYNDSTYQDFFAPTFSVYPLLKDSLMSEFVNYKKDHIRSALFGRDVIFDFPVNFIDDEVWHIHLNLQERALWSNNKSQFSCTSDDYLIYTRGFFNDKAFSLLGLVTPNAHERMPAHNTQLLRFFANAAANFRNSH